MYQISANLVYRELRNAIFEGKKLPTSITFPDSGNIFKMTRDLDLAVP